MIISVVVLLVLVGCHATVGNSLARVLGIAGIGVWCALNPRDDRRIKIFLCSLMVPLIALFIAFVLDSVETLCPLKYDLYLHAIDHAIGFCPDEVAVRLVSLPAIRAVVAGFYELLLTMTVAAYGWALYDNGAHFELFASYIISGLCAFLYLIVPACGPGFLPASALTYGHSAPPLALVDLNFPANCIPSVHLSTALCMWFFNRSNPVARVATASFVLITAFATLTLGEHYLIDLVLSFPFAYFVISMATGFFTRAAWAISVVLIWLACIRSQIQVLLCHPLLLWISAFATVGVFLANMLNDSVTVGGRVNSSEING